MGRSGSAPPCVPMLFGAELRSAPAPRLIEGDVPFWYERNRRRDEPKPINIGVPLQNGDQKSPKFRDTKGHRRHARGRWLRSFQPSRRQKAGFLDRIWTLLPSPRRAATHRPLLAFQ